MNPVNTHNNFYYFTLALIVLLLTSAIAGSVEGSESSRLLQGFILMTELVAFFTLNLSRQWRRFVGLMLLLLLLSIGLREFTDWSLSPLGSLAASLIFYSGMAYVAARQVLFSGSIELNTIVGTVAVYLLLGVIWTILYLIALEFWPSGFNGIEYGDWNDNFGITAYFSYVTMTTLGYGDISPAILLTRTLAYLQAICGTFYMAVVVASLIGGLSRKSK